MCVYDIYIYIYMIAFNYLTQQKPRDRVVQKVRQFAFASSRKQSDRTKVKVETQKQGRLPFQDTL